MDAQIAKKTQDLASAEAMRDQTQIMLPYVNWEQYLAPVPLSIAILGELVFISSKTHFSINKSPPPGGYKYIRHTDLFQACLMQVCNSGWWAFNEAHKNMDQIRLSTMTVPDFIETTVNILFQESDQVIKTQLPLQLDKIQQTANEGLVLATETKGRFDEVTNTIHELLKVCTAAKDKELEENKLRKMSSEEAAKRSEKAMKSLEKELREARESYKAARKSMPNGREMMAMDFVGAITEGILELFTGVISELNAPVNQMCKAATTVEKFPECEPNHEAKSMENMERNQKELNEILIKLKNCEVKNLDFKAILEILSQGLKAMARLKEHWEKMVQFFQMISNIVKVNLTYSLTEFANTSDGMMQLSYDDKLFLKDQIYNEAFQATNIASLVHMISSTYTDVSRDPISSLGRLFSLDVNKPEFEHERQQLHANCNQAQRAIQQLIRQNKEEYKRKTQARLEKIDRELLPILPAATPEQIRNIESAAKEGFFESVQMSFN